MVRLMVTIIDDLKVGDNLNLPVCRWGKVLQFHVNGKRYCNTVGFNGPVYIDKVLVCDFQCSYLDGK